MWNALTILPVLLLLLWEIFHFHNDETKHMIEPKTIEPKMTILQSWLFEDIWLSCEFLKFNKSSTSLFTVLYLDASCIELRRACLWVNMPCNHINMWIDLNDNLVCFSYTVLAIISFLCIMKPPECSILFFTEADF